MRFGLSIERVIAHDLACWPMPPARVLYIASSDAGLGIAIAKQIQFVQITVIADQGIASEIANAACSAGVADRLHIIAGRWSEINWGNHFEIVLVHDQFRQFTDQTAVEFLRKSMHCLEEGGRVLAIELIASAESNFTGIPDQDSGAATRQKAVNISSSRLLASGRQAGFEHLFISELEGSEWSVAIFERDEFSAYKVI